MGGSSGKAPQADPALGKAALMSAQTGQDMLAWSKTQSNKAGQWAGQDRTRYRSVFQPLENKFIGESKNYDTVARQNMESNQAVADVRKQGAISRGIGTRQSAAMGIDPRSGRAGAGARSASLNESLAAAGAGNVARGAVRQEGRARLAQAVNMGSGMQVNPGSSLGMATATGASGFQGAMSGYGQQGQLLNQQFGQEMQVYQSQQDAQSGLMSGLGSIAGAAIMMSSKDYKENKRPARGALKAVNKMPVEDWDYKPGIADGGSHTGPYAEDFKAATGKGDGKSIPVVDAIGVLMGATQELSKKVDKLAQPRGAMRMAA